MPHVYYKMSKKYIFIIVRIIIDILSRVQTDVFDDERTTPYFILGPPIIKLPWWLFGIPL